MSKLYGIVITKLHKPFSNQKYKIKREIKWNLKYIYIYIIIFKGYTNESIKFGKWDTSPGSAMHTLQAKSKSQEMFVLWKIALAINIFSQSYPITIQNKNVRKNKTH